MSRRLPTIALMAIFMIASAGCGPSREQFATQTALMRTATAAMGTPTPTDTLTPTTTPSKTITPTPDSRYYEIGGEVEYSYIPPRGWSKNADEKPAGWLAPDGIGGGNIAFSFGKSAGMSAKEIANASVADVPHLISSGEFAIDTGLDAYRIIFPYSTEDLEMVMTIYIFQQGDVFVSAVYGRLEGKYPELDTYVDQSMMTFRFE